MDSTSASILSSNSNSNVRSITIGKNEIKNNGIVKKGRKSNKIDDIIKLMKEQ
jgi:hypothetical protein